MKQTPFTITENAPVQKDTYRMVLAGDASAITEAGQFVNLRLPENFLRRPISVHDADGRSVTLLYKIAGRGTAQMAALPEGAVLDVLTGLGHGFQRSRAGKKPLLIGGGIGAAPLYFLAKQLLAEGVRPTVLMGFNTASELLCCDAFRTLGCETIVATADGSRGVRGFVTEALPGDFSYFYACGPTPMLKALCAATSRSGELSLEARMGCGFGACMGCTIQTASGPRRICKDGPVFRREELLWDD